MRQSDKDTLMMMVWLGLAFVGAWLTVIVVVSSWMRTCL